MKLALLFDSWPIRTEDLKKTLPIGCVYKDPKTGYNYQVIEKKLF
jgi:hypothetical protein